MKYFIIAGEASGDLHGSNLVRGLLLEDPQAQIRCYGGSLMQAAGAELLCDYKGGDVMGVTDILASAGKLLSRLKTCKKQILDFHPDVVILIDYPGFNLKIAQFAHNKGFKVFYYIAPKTWASRAYRDAKLKRYVDRLFIVFPFEKQYFERRGVPYTYAGNPLIDAVDAHVYSPVCQEPYIALLPGSRKGEISRMMPICMKVAGDLGLRVIIAGAPGRTEADYQSYIAGMQNVSLVFGRTYDVLKGAQAAIINSGTASLEAALLGCPQVVCWSTSAITAFVADKILHILQRIKYVSLANLILDKGIFKELLQDAFTPEAVEAEIKSLIEPGSPRSQAMREDYAAVREALGGSGASRAVAREMIIEINK